MQDTSSHKYQVYVRLNTNTKYTTECFSVNWNGNFVMSAHTYVRGNSVCCSDIIVRTYMNNLRALDWKFQW